MASMDNIVSQDQTLMYKKLQVIHKKQDVELMHLVGQEVDRGYS